MIMLDLNADLGTVNGRRMSELCHLHNLQFRINAPTRITSLSRTCLDQIITNCPNFVQHTIVEPPVSINDHCTVGMKMNFKVASDTPYERLVWLYENADQEGFQ